MEKLYSRFATTAYSYLNLFSLKMMKRIFTGFVMAFITTTTITVSAQVSTPPSTGDGSAGNPYQIATLENLYWLSQNSGQWDKSYIQTADIDATATSGWASGAGFTPIGNASTNFSGNYNGQNHIISNVTINRPSESNIGLFGKSGTAATIQNLGVVNADVKGNWATGTVIGYNYGTIDNCFSSGSVIAGGETGGFAGDHVSGSIINCHTTTNISGSLMEIGGFVGFQSAPVNHCYSTGSVSSSSIFDPVGCGGFVGWCFNSISNCYSRGDVTRSTGSATDFGGFCGNNYGYSITNCYSTGKVIYSGSTNPTNKGFVGAGSGTMTGNFWDTETSEQSTNSIGGATGKTTAEMKTQGTFTGWDFNYSWNIEPSTNNGYPFLRAPIIPNATQPSGDGSIGNPFQIATLDNLVWLSQNSAYWNKNYVQTADIDASSSASWYYRTGFLPIGNNGTYFSGTYNGQNHVITNLAINRPSTNYIGLFGYISGVSAKVEKLGVENVNIIGGYYTGGLAGYINPGTIKDCFTSGSVSSNLHSCGGLIGYNEPSSTVTSCYSTANVSAFDYGGGFIGYNQSSTINNCFSRGDVTRPSGTGSNFGGFGGCSISSSITNCYSTGKVIYIGVSNPTSQGFIPSPSGTMIDNFWDTETSAQTSNTGGGATGKTTSEMKTQSTFTAASWDFTNTWKIVVSINSGYPILSSIKTNQTITFGALTPVTYGDPSFNLTATASSGLTVSYQSSNLSVATVSGNAVTIVGAGTTTITASQAGDDNYNAATQVQQILNVNTKPITVTADASQTKIYGSADPTLTYGVSPALIGSDLFSGTLSRDAGEDVGPYAIGQGTLTAGSNYNISFVADNFSITAKPITVTADASQSKVYGSADPTLTYGVSPALMGGDVFNGTLSRDAGEDVGLYAIGQGTLTAGSNYNIFFVADNFSITAKPLIITGVTANNKVYDGTATATLTGGTLSGVVSGDVVTLSPGIGLFDNKNAGSGKAVTCSGYTITGTDAGNYSLTQPTGLTADITQAAPVITWSNPADIIYGTALSSTQLNATADVPGIFTYTPAEGVILSVGQNQSLSVLFIPDDAVNYNNADKSVLINVMTLTDIADLQQKVVSVYPNPTNRIITLSGLSSVTNDKTVSRTISDIYGKTTFIKKLEKNIGSEIIDISSLADGVYFIILQTDMERIVKRFVKQ
jgi:YDG domain/MBG domain (YGX type)/Secretion system C-terminal sorting domain/The GLUG motif